MTHIFRTAAGTTAAALIAPAGVAVVATATASPAEALVVPVNPAPSPAVLAGSSPSRPG